MDLKQKFAIPSQDTVLGGLMMQKNHALWGASLLVIAVVLLHGRSVHGEIRMLSARLDGECAQSGSAALGWAELTLDTDTGELTYAIAYEGLESNEFLAHIHGPIEQACGNVGSGNIVVELPIGSPKAGTAILTPQQQQDLLQGLDYVNIHTVIHSVGEISGVVQNLQKSRAVSVVAPAPPAAAGVPVEQAIRVRLKDLYQDVTELPVLGCPERTGLPDLSAFEGDTSYRWFGEPRVVSDGTVPPSRDYLVAPLQCCPYFRDWTPAGLSADFGVDVDTQVIHAVGPAVVPCSFYEVQFVDSSCADLTDEGCYTYPMFIRTGKWADVIPSFSTAGQPNFLDISAVVNCYKSIPMPGGQNQLRCQLRGNDVSLDDPVNFLQISAAVDGYKSLPYPESGPTACGPCP